MSLAYIPKSKWREASLAFSFQQCITWFLGLLVVELNLIEYPVRELAKVNRTSFLFEFIQYPIVSSFYCIYYPLNRTLRVRILYTSTFCTALVIPEILFEKYTDLISYVHWEWYVSWLSIYISLTILWYFYKWYFRLEE
ncbi:CBO0543 family protein [Bacillus carboniphilus]|uniref:CBO0543 family protein n=1 Tax=Bacillus carboniphilus TaxID=86663 RepID=UPI003CD060CA